MEAVASEVIKCRELRSMPGWVAGVWRVLCGFWKLSVGVVLAMSPWGAVIVVGWTSRVMQRTAFKVWWKRTERPFKKMMVFREAASHHPGWAGQANWPNWLVSQAIGDDLRRGRIHRLVAGLWTNAWLGVLSLINTYLVLGLPCLLMATWWYAGWQISFNKAYEYFSFGATVSLVAIVLFALGMFYVPIAQARQAITGEWRAFWHFSLVRRVVRRRWFSCLLLALAYAVAGAVVMVLLALPMAAEFQDWFNQLPADRLRPAIRGYYLLGALFIFPAFLGLRWGAARIYASAMAHMVATGEVRIDELTAPERLALSPNFPHPQKAPADWTKRQAVRSWTLSAPLRLACGVIAFAAWLVFVAEVYISQFFVYRGPRVWMSHPLVQLPWADYTPPGSQDPR